MKHLISGCVMFVGASLALPFVQAASVSKQQADAFSRKIDQIVGYGSETTENVGRRTPVSESELNSWFAFDATPLLPPGVSEPHVSLLGNGKVSGRAVIDLDTIAQRKSAGGSFDVWSLLRGKVPVTVAGVLTTRDGLATFMVEHADISGVPVPKTALQQLVNYYSRSPNKPEGVQIDDAFPLPASIRQIAVGAGQAMIVQ